MKEDKHVLDDQTCPICFNYMVEPVRLPCKHLFCFTCIEQATLNDAKCPLCRYQLEDHFELNIDEDYQANFMNKYPEEYQTALDELIKIKTLEKDLIKIFLEYGNTHSSIETDHQNKHKWVFFIRTNNEEYPLKDLVDKVTIELHPSFNRSLVQLKHPFKFAARGWGVFEIPITVVWKEWTKLPPTNLSHMLSFDGDGKSYKSCVKIPKLDQ